LLSVEVTKHVKHIIAGSTYLEKDFDVLLLGDIGALQVDLLSFMQTCFECSDIHKDAQVRLRRETT